MGSYDTICADKDEIHSINNAKCVGKTTNTIGTKQPFTCSSKLSKAVEVVLGLTAEVILFDKARNRVKEHPQNKSYSEEYKTSLAIIHTRVSKQRRLLKEEITTWEKEYFTTSGGQLPTHDDMIKNSSTKLLLKRLKYADYLLNKFVNG